MALEEPLVDFVTRSLLPCWRNAGIDPASGGFRERLDASLRPAPLPYRRLLVQCRQIFSFAEGAVLGCPSWAVQAAGMGFDFMRAHYWDAERGGWIYSLGEGGALPATTRDLYAHSFVLLACSAYYRATGETEALVWAKRTIEFIRRHFKKTGSGFVTALDADLNDFRQPRQQNPHMHLFEACSLMFELTSDRTYAAVAEEIVSLLIGTFFDPETGTLTEFFTDHWLPDPVNGDIVEPGHHFEWVWLIHRWLRIAERQQFPTRQAELTDVADRLLQWAIRHGIDASYGGVFDQMNRAGAVIKDSKRIWPVAEAIKGLQFAAAFAGDAAGLPLVSERLSDLLHSRYLKPESGTWLEVLNRDLTPQSDHLPASTLYHLVMAARELVWLRQNV